MNGFLLVNKDAGMSSFDVIRKLRKITGIRKMGHTGTLDPFATGLMIICLERYTRLAYLLEAECKSYRVCLKLGEKSETGDTEGKIIQTCASWNSNLLPLLQEYVLNITELPIPSHSAVKVSGRRAYDYARQGIDLKLPMRQTNITDFELHTIDFPYLEYSCTVSKGTYIRSLSEVIAEFLGTVGHTVFLCRTKIGRVDLSRASNLDALSAISNSVVGDSSLEDSSTWKEAVLEAQTLLGHIPSQNLEQHEIEQLLTGISVSNPGHDEESLLIYAPNGHVVSVCSRTSDVIRPKINLGSLNNDNQ